jgi:hypothetical protein
MSPGMVMQALFARAYGIAIALHDVHDGLDVNPVLVHVGLAGLMTVNLKAMSTYGSTAADTVTSRDPALWSNSPGVVSCRLSPSIACVITDSVSAVLEFVRPDSVSVVLSATIGTLKAKYTDNSLSAHGKLLLCSIVYLVQTGHRMLRGVDSASVGWPVAWTPCCSLARSCTTVTGVKATMELQLMSAEMEKPAVGVLRQQLGFFTVKATMQVVQAVNSSATVKTKVPVA